MKRNFFRARCSIIKILDMPFFFCNKSKLRFKNFNKSRSWYVLCVILTTLQKSKRHVPYLMQKACPILYAKRSTKGKWVAFLLQRPAVTGECTSDEALLYSSIIANMLFCFDSFIFVLLLVPFVGSGIYLWHIWIAYIFIFESLSLIWYGTVILQSCRAKQLGQL